MRFKKSPTDVSCSTMLFITSTDFTVTSALTNRLLSIARGLVENKVKVTWILLTTQPTKSISEDCRYKGIAFTTVLKQNSRGSANKYTAWLLRGCSLFLLPKVLGRAIGNKKQVFCFTIDDSFVFLMTYYFILRSYGVKIFHERTEYPYLNISKSLISRIDLFLYYRLFIARIDHIFVISTALQKHFIDYLEFRNIKTPVSILNIIVESDRFENDTVVNFSTNPKDNSQKDIVYIGTMYGDKDGVYYLIAAFQSLREHYPNARLVLVGDNTQVGRMSKILSVIDPDDDSTNVVFTGLLDRLGVSQYLKNAYCVALSRPNNVQAKYGFPTKLGEYLASGKPVIVTKVGDIPLFLKDGENAYLAEPDNVDSFAEKLRECLNDSSKAKAIGERGRQLAHSVFDYKECVKIVVSSLGEQQH